MNLPREDRTRDCARQLRRDLKHAVTDFGGGRGDLDGVRNQIERIARYIVGNPRSSLEEAMNGVVLFVCRHAPDRIGDPGMPGVSFLDLYKRMKEARNDHAHTGTPMVLSCQWTTGVAGVLLEALEAAACRQIGNVVRDVMVTNPECAHGWQTLADLRRTMLVNDYSVLPIVNGWCGDSTWCCVDAEKLARYLRSGGRRKRTLAEVRSAKDMDILKATAVHEDTPVGEVLGSLKLPVVVTKGKANAELVGIVTPFDLL